MLKFICLGSGSSGNGYFLWTEHDAIMIDAGISIKLLKRHISVFELPWERLRGLFITHDHADHIKSVGKLAVDYQIQVFSTDAVHEGIARNYCVSPRLKSEHCQKMIKSNGEFYTKLSKEGHLDTPCNILLEDARHTSIPSKSVDMIITSPPYVTSYEYADIHQLTGYWMEYITDIHEFRKQFIGTSYSGNKVLEVSSSVQAQEIVDALAQVGKHIAQDVAQYFNDMNDVAKEMHRILKQGGYACIVIGNTKIKEVQVRSAEVFYEFLRNIGLKKVAVIKRSIPYKLMPTLRDKTTGKFTKLNNPNCNKVYPNEYIIIMQN